jgi:mRNA interferase MazF
MLRGEVRVVDFDPARGAEASKRRTAVIVSNDAANSTAARLGRGVVTVVPISSNVERVHPFQVLLPEGAGGLEQDSKAQAEQVRSVAAERIGARLGDLPAPLMVSLDSALRLQLAL